MKDATNKRKDIAYELGKIEKQFRRIMRELLDCQHEITELKGKIEKKG